MKPMFLIMAYAALAISLAQGQIPVLLADVATVINAGEGDLYLTETDALYIGMQDGSLRPIGIVTQEGTSDGQILKWNATTNQWESASADVGVLTLERDTIWTSKRARVVIDPADNVNFLTFAMTPGSFELNQTNATLSGNAITGLEGDLRFIVQPNLDSDVIRTNFYLNFLVNSLFVKRVYGQFYARNASGHDDTGSQFIFEYEGATPSDQFSFVLQRETSNGGTVKLVSEGDDLSYIFVEEFNEVEVVTGVTATE